MFRELDYQTKVFDAIDHYLDVLNDLKANADEVAKVKAEKPDIDIPDPDFPAETFDRLKAEKCLPVSVTRDAEFSSRFDGIGRPVANITLKVPTGGGKTWIAVKAADKIMNKYLHRNFGFVLWIVPNEAIYTQTLKNFRNREHPYRLALDRASRGRVEILEKTDSLNAADVDTHLCVMVLMLQSSNRQNKETLRMFRDRGDVHGFLPHEGEQNKHKQLLTEIPNLDCYEGHQLAKAYDNASTAEMIQRGDPGLLFTHIKDSLGNALRLIQPVVVMDEGHKAVSELAHNTLYGFNPSFVLELTATPKDVREKSGKMRYANLLVEVTGIELDAEGMIKMPLVLTASNQQDWKPVLNAAVDRLNSLRTAAEIFRADKNRYIRPILLVQVERTGRDTRDGAHIHAEDVRDWLLQTGFDEAEIAIKTADQNDLKQPENQNLLSAESQCRVIITKEALKEGWDCPFAYILCSLASYSNLSAMTQLVGRILRQPQALKTDIQDLDQAYILTHRSETANIVRHVKAGLENDGLKDLLIEVTGTDTSTSTQGIVRRIERRAAFKNKKIVLPKLLVKSDRVLRELDYETDILTQTD